MTLPRKLATIACYLIDIEQLYYDLGNNMELNEKEKNTRKNLHRMASEFLTILKMKAFKDILREEKE